MEIRQGSDITSVKRVAQAASRRGDQFLDRVFTAGERGYCESKRMKFEHYAARFAAKEAVMKAVEVKRRDRYSFRRIEVRRHPTGKPYIHLADEMRKRLGLPKKYQIELSMAHERDHAIATVILVLP